MADPARVPAGRLGFRRKGKKGPVTAGGPRSTLVIVELTLTWRAHAGSSAGAAQRGHAPFWDALTTAISLAAQFLLNAKRIENWGFWIAADLIYVPLYVVKRLDLTALVYLLFLGLCAAGVTSWRALRDSDQAPAPVSVVRSGGA